MRKKRAKCRTVVKKQGYSGLCDLSVSVSSCCLTLCGELSYFAIMRTGFFTNSTRVSAVKLRVAPSTKAIPTGVTVDIPGNKAAESEDLACRLSPRHLEAIVRRSGSLVDWFRRPDAPTTSSVELI